VATSGAGSLPTYGTQGFRIDNLLTGTNGWIGSSVAAGDVYCDGYADLIIGKNAL